MDGGFVCFPISFKGFLKILDRKELYKVNTVQFVSICIGWYVEGGVDGEKILSFR